MTLSEYDGRHRVTNDGKTASDYDTGHFSDNQNGVSRRSVASPEMACWISCSVLPFVSGTLSTMKTKDAASTPATASASDGCKRATAAPQPTRRHRGDAPAKGRKV